MTGHYKKKFNVKFDLDLGVIKAKIVSFSKKLFLLSPLVSIARPGFLCAVNMASNDLSRAQTDIGKRFRFFFPALKRPYNKQLINLVRSVITGKSQTSALMYWPRCRSVNTSTPRSEISL